MTGAELKRLATELELDVVGAAPARPYERTEQDISERRERGLFADMRFTMARPEVSCHPELLFDGARTVISAALCYYTPADPPGEDEGQLARYTWRDGYADLRARLDELGTRLGGRYRVLVDANDHVDREAAVRSGVGFYGKNTMVITPSHGSWVVLGTLVTEAEIEATPPLDLDCGSCRLCVDACPTGALDEPGVLDATRCLSYWTQAPEPIPLEYREELGAMVYGCDVCQDVCPWNRATERRRAGSPLPDDSRPVVALRDWLERPGDELVAEFDRLYVPRNDARWLRRNALLAAGNVGTAALAPLVEIYAQDDDPVLNDAAGVGAGTNCGAIVVTEAEDRLRLALLVHEVRSPAAALAAIAATLSDDDVDPDSRRTLLELALAACSGIERVVGDAPVGSLHLDDVDVGDIVREAAASAILGGARVRPVLGEGSLVVHADRDRLRQALGNIVENAVLHSPPGSEVVVLVRVESRTLLVSVTDCGSGIAAADHDRIFEPGVRLDTSRPGLGLGLAVARAIAVSHGGTISVESASRRRGDVHDDAAAARRTSTVVLARHGGVEAVRTAKPASSVMLGDVERRTSTLDAYVARRGDSYRQVCGDLVHLDESRLLDHDVSNAIRRLDPREADSPSRRRRAADAEARVSKITAVQDPERAAAPAPTLLGCARAVVAGAEARALFERDALAHGSDPLDEWPSWLSVVRASASPQARIRTRSGCGVAHDAQSREKGWIADPLESHGRRSDLRAVHSSHRHGVVGAAAAAHARGEEGQPSEETRWHQRRGDDALPFCVTSSSRPVVHRCSSSPLGTTGSRCSCRTPRPSPR